MSKNLNVLVVETLIDERTLQKMTNSLAGQKHVAAISIVPIRPTEATCRYFSTFSSPSSSECSRDIQPHIVPCTRSRLSIKLFPGFLPVTFSAVNIETRGQFCLTKGLRFVDISPRDRCEQAGFHLVDWPFVGRSADILHSV
jgi:hypothetical protein